jgi:23S rRNA pseudouridine2604 synthase
MTEPVRLSKHLAALLPCSRREAELYIAGGWVRVDGEVVEEPQFKVTTQKVELDLGAAAEPALPASMLWHKPAGVDADGAGDPLSGLIRPATRSADDGTGVRMLRRHFAHLDSVLVLDPEASGLVMLTQDRHLVRKLGSEFGRFEQEYVVEVEGQLPADGLERMRRGEGIESQAPPAIKVSWQSETRLRVAAKAILPGQIRQLCEAAGLNVKSIKRIRIGRLPMARLAPGEWRYLGADERL